MKSFPSLSKSKAFTLIELLTVVTIIAILTGLILGTAGFIQKKAARSRAEAEIAALSAALERYRADNGEYPPASAGVTTPTASAGGTTIVAAGSLALYKALSADLDANRSVTTANVGGLIEKEQTTYFEFNPTMLLPAGGSGNVTGIADPFGGFYGYFVPAPNAAPVVPIQRNPTFDLWSVAGGTRTKFGDSAKFEASWIKNW